MSLEFNKLVIVSTRLPISVSKVDGKLVFAASSGGLANGVASIKKSKDSIWIGWPGIVSDDLTRKEKNEIIVQLKKHGCFPVFLNSDQVEKYYSGYCNATLWPLLHCFPLKSGYDESHWKSYEEVNQLFANEIIKFASDSSVFWVHDYQLMLVPSMLRKILPNATIGFFLHTPFPSFETYRQLPERLMLIKGLLGSNLIGFHTYDYVRHFLDSALRVAGIEDNLGQLKIEKSIVFTDAFPIGIDYNKFAKSAKSAIIKKLLPTFSSILSDKSKLILSVDRADYSKGIPARLDAFEHLLKKHGNHHKNIKLVMVAVPSRGDVEAYKDLRLEIEQKVSRINGQYSTINWSPITYLYQSLSFDEISMLYKRADVMLVTPLRDGMNLVAKEYVASKHDDKGVLVLSEMAGAANEFPEAILVNPYDIPQVAEAIDFALNMSIAEQRRRLKKMQKRISEYNIETWANDYLSELSIAVEANSSKPKNLSKDNIKKLLSDYKHSSKRLIMLDYDGTLRSFVSSPEEFLARPTAKVKKILKSLTKDKRNKVVIVSGRPKTTLENFFDDKGLGLVAEHGGWIFETGSWVKTSAEALKWKKQILPLLKQFVSRTPGSEVEIKDFSLVWHYRQVLPDLAYVRKEELKIAAHDLLESSDIGIFEGHKIIEIKPKKIHKGVITKEIVESADWDFIMAIGDDYTDEDMFSILPASAYSIKVGFSETAARFQLDDVPAVVDLIDLLKS